MWFETSYAEGSTREGEQFRKGGYAVGAYQTYSYFCHEVLS
jgi:hypothetical protein